MTINFDRLTAAAYDAEVNWAALYQGLGLRLAGEALDWAESINCYVPPALRADGTPEAKPSARVYQETGNLVVFSDTSDKKTYLPVEVAAALTGLDLQQAAAKIAEELDIDPARLGDRKAAAADPDKPEVEPQDEAFKLGCTEIIRPGQTAWEEVTAPIATGKPGLTPAGLGAVHGMQIVNTWGESKAVWLARCATATTAGESKPARSDTLAAWFPAHRLSSDGEWTCSGGQLMRLDGEPLPLESGGETKAKTMPGSKDGLVFAGPAEMFDHSQLVLKVEGISDLVMAHQMIWFGDPDTAGGVVAFTNIGGCGSFPYDQIEALRDKRVLICHDADEPGQAGARQLLLNLARQDIVVGNIELPYEVAAKHGRDLRDLHFDRDYKVDLSRPHCWCNTLGDAVAYCVDWFIRHNPAGILKDRATLRAMAEVAKSEPGLVDGLRERLKQAGVKKGQLDKAVKSATPKKKRGRKKPEPQPVATPGEIKQLMQTLGLSIADVFTANNSTVVALEVRGGHHACMRVGNLSYFDLRALIGADLAKYVQAPGDPADSDLMPFNTFVLGLLDMIAAHPVGLGLYLTDGIHELEADDGGAELAILSNRRWYRLNENTWEKSSTVVLHGRRAALSSQRAWLHTDQLNDAMLRMQDPAARATAFRKLRDMLSLWEWGDKTWMPHTAAALLPVMWLQSTLPLRPITCLIGESRSGKSTLLDLFATLMNGGGNVIVAGTWRGVRDKLAVTSLPAMVDEIDTMRGVDAERLLHLLRLSTDGREMVVSSSSTTAVGKAIKHAPLLCGIGNPAERAPDKNRQVVLTIHPSKGGGTLQNLRQQIRERSVDLRDLGYDILAGSLILLPDIRARYSNLMGQLATLPGNCRELESLVVYYSVAAAFNGASNEATFEALKRRMEARQEEKKAIGEDDEIPSGKEILQEILNSVVDTGWSGMQEIGPKSVSDLIKYAAEYHQSGGKTGGPHADVLFRLGVLIRTPRHSGTCAVFTRKVLRGYTGLLKGTPFDRRASNRERVVTFARENLAGFVLFHATRGVSGQDLHIPIVNLDKVMV